MKKLPEDFKHDWLSALRSGKYEQATHYLRAVTRGEDDEEETTLGYCCLGVACLVYKIDQDISGTEELPLIGMVPNEVLDVFNEEIAVDNGDGTDMVTSQVQLKLAKMNDSGKSFDEIATWIEENL